MKGLMNKVKEKLENNSDLKELAEAYGQMLDSKAGKHFYEKLQAKYQNNVAMSQKSLDQNQSFALSQRAAGVKEVLDYLEMFKILNK